MFTPRYVASSIATTPTDVAGILTMMFGARDAKRSAWSASATASRASRGSVCIDRRPLYPWYSSNAGSRSLAAMSETSSTTVQPISDSLAVGRSAAISAIRASQRSWSARIAARAMTGLHVAPTAPQLMDRASTVGSALSFHSAVGVVCVMVSSGDDTPAGTCAVPGIELLLVSELMSGH